MNGVKFKSILNWLKENKTWLFSGIGVFVIVLIFSVLSIFSSYFHNYFFVKKEVTDHKEFINKFVEQLTPQKIISDIYNTPILQRKDKIKHYKGLKIKSQGELSAIENINNRMFMFLTVGKFPSICIVFFEINLKDYPGIDLLSKGNLIKFEGNIDDIYRNSITLINAKITF